MNILKESSIKFIFPPTNVWIDKKKFKVIDFVISKAKKRRDINLGVREARFIHIVNYRIREIKTRYSPIHNAHDYMNDSHSELNVGLTASRSHFFSVFFTYVRNGFRMYACVWMCVYSRILNTLLFFFCMRVCVKRVPNNTVFVARAPSDSGLQLLHSFRR